MAGKFGVPHVYTDYRELLAHNGLDAVSIVAPPHLHAEMTAAALERDLHVLCEKPLAMNAAEAEAMLKQADAAGRVHMTAFNHRHIPALAYMKELHGRGLRGRTRATTWRAAGSARTALHAGFDPLLAPPRGSWPASA